VSWGEASQRLLAFLIDVGYIPKSWDCGCAGEHESPLRVACRVGNRPAVIALIPFRLSCDTPEILLEAAVTAGQLDIVRLLIQDKENDKKSLEPKLLALALEHQQLVVARYFVRKRVPLSASLVAQRSSVVGQLLCTLTESENDEEAVATFKSGTSTVSLKWKCLSLAGIQESWLTENLITVTELDVSKNQLLSLPGIIFAHLKSLQKLNASHNSLSGLGNDSAVVQANSLEALDISHNQLTHLSRVLFTLPSLTTLKASHNHLRSLPESNSTSKSWSQSTLKHINVSHNKMESLPASFKQLCFLIHVDVSHNQLKELPSNWGTSVMKTLNASHNYLTEFPVGTEGMLSGSLKELDLSHNQLSKIPWSIPRLAHLITLNLSHNHLQELPPPDWWMCTQLEELNLSNNLLDNFESDGILVADALGNLSPKGDKKARQRISQQVDIGEMESTKKNHKANIEFPIERFRHCLKRLKLDSNRLVAVPDSVCGLSSLAQLNLSNNPLNFLPIALGSLTNCWLIELQGLELVNIPDYVRPGIRQGCTKRLLAYLRAQLRRSVPYTRVKLMVVGLQKRGKTSLLKRLRGEPLPNVDISTVGVDVAEWELVLPGLSGSGKGKRQGTKVAVVLSTWDLAGQEVYYATHQCFLSGNTLYMAIFSLENGEAGVDGLKVWLLNIQARAPDSLVLIVATHKDKVKGSDADQKIKELLSMVSDRYCIKGYPNIVAICAVSNVTGEGITELQRHIQNAVSIIQDQDTKTPLIERLIPSSYLSLEKAVSSEAQQRRENKGHGVIEQDEFLKMAAQNEDNDIHDEEELHLAAKFLHEAGVLLHYNDQLRGLANLYFIDPSWLIDLLAEFVTVQEKQSFIQNGFLLRRNVPFLLRSKRYPEQYIDQYLQLLQHFEIALMIDDEKLLVPSMLPVDKPDIPGVCSSDDSMSDPVPFGEFNSSLRNSQAINSVVPEEERPVKPRSKLGGLRDLGRFFISKPRSPPSSRNQHKHGVESKNHIGTLQVSQSLDVQNTQEPFSIARGLSLSSATISSVVTNNQSNQEFETDRERDEKRSDHTEDSTLFNEDGDTGELVVQDDDVISVDVNGKDDGVEQDSRSLSSFRSHLTSVASVSSLPNFSTHRYYLMAYVPSGFWSRLIVRLVVNLERAGFGRPFSIKDDRQPSPMSDYDYDDDVDIWSKPKNQMNRSSVVLWRTGVVIVHSKGQFVVEALKHASHVRSQIAQFLKAGTTRIDGISVVVRSRGVKDFSAMGYITDQIDGLIEDWFPGLTELDVYGVPLVQRFIPWQTNEAGSLSSPDSLSFEVKTHMFELAECAKAAAVGNIIKCPLDDSDVPLSDLVPDLMLSDLPPEMHIDTAEFDFFPSPETQLGAGGAGEVYKGTYQGQLVAVKQFSGAVGTHDSGHSSVMSDSLLAELRGEDMVSLLQELRQEAVVLCHLKHPCVVALIGVSIRPLCLVMELAPKKSLSSVLDEKVKEKRKKAALSHPNSFVMTSKISGVVLGNELTYRIAYQIILALRYLHLKTIIYRDLKPDNVLVWSLSLDTAINVKLSDYGISRFASPAGLKGEELGTPGFMAPEAMKKKNRDSAFDAKVDIFSFGMVLFQLLSGVRPYNHCKEQEINRLVFAGERPELKKYISPTCFPRLEELMYNCWQAVSYERPAADSIVKEMEDPSFSCLQHHLPRPQDGDLCKIDCVYARPKVMSKAKVVPQLGRGNRRHQSSSSSLMSHPWILAHSDQRMLSVLNTELGVFKIKQMQFDRRKVTCIAYVDGCMWMGAEVNAWIEVVAQPLVGMPKCSWTLKVPAPVLALATTIDYDATAAHGELVVSRVIAALADGQLYTFARLMSWEELHIKTKTHSEDLKDSWQHEKSLVIKSDTPINSMVIVKDQTELWCTSNNYLFIVQLSDFQIVHSFQLFASSKSYITWLAADKQNVYGIDKRAPFVLQWNIESRQLSWILDCSRKLLEVGKSVSVAPYENVYVDIMNRASQVLSSAVAAKGKGSLSQRRSQSVAVDHDRKPTNWAVGMKGSKGSDFSPYSTVSGNLQRPTYSVHQGYRHPLTNVVLQTVATASRLPQRITSLLIVQDTLWVARGMGDIIILRRDLTESGHCRVVGQLRPKESADHYGNSSDQKLALVDNERVLASQYLEPRYLQTGRKQRQLLAVYGAWGSAEFDRLALFQRCLKDAEKESCH
jgi:leucine-rich repeat kinase 1